VGAAVCSRRSAEAIELRVPTDGYRGRFPRRMKNSSNANEMHDRVLLPRSLSLFVGLGRP
jgi:hypothetical protein